MTMGVQLIWVSATAAVIAMCSMAVSYMNLRRLALIDAAAKVVLSFVEVEHPKYKLINRGTHTASFVSFDLNSAARFHFSDTGPTMIDPGETWEYEILNPADPDEKLPSVRAAWRQPGFGKREVVRDGFILVEERQA